MPSPDTTMVVTACNRPAYLEQTLDSILARDRSGIKRIIVIEDSTNPEVAGLVARVLADVPHLFLQNSRNLGQIASIDRAYAEVDTPYIYHCEEDWVFPSSLFLEESRTVLSIRPDICAVMLRDWDEASHEQRIAIPETIADVPVRVADPMAHRRWGAFSFNPGLRRLSDYAEHGPYSAIGPERDLSFHHKLRGFRLAYLEAGDVRHIGEDATVSIDELRRRRAPGFLWKSVKHRAQFLHFRLFGK